MDNKILKIKVNMQFKRARVTFNQSSLLKKALKIWIGKAVLNTKEIHSHKAYKYLKITFRKIIKYLLKNH